MLLLINFVADDIHLHMYDTNLCTWVNVMTKPLYKTMKKNVNGSVGYLLKDYMSLSYATVSICTYVVCASMSF